MSYVKYHAVPCLVLLLILGLIQCTFFENEAKEERKPKRHADSLLNAYNDDRVEVFKAGENEQLREIQRKYALNWVRTEENWNLYAGEVRIGVLRSGRFFED